ncbi:TDP-N-acetylfucosamine:lipid II N-acetylfucosaminyltransferase [Idiomarina seosinensis]|uniref:TDP-N-acetylfucosamine:lipid II N-acetylfucosaminyltransferase n=1 Tax=Idiomarina seosinensis TaxID=281739 RepID=UPI00384EE66C
MILHIAKLDKFIPPFIKFTNDNFPPEDHEFYLYGDESRYKVNHAHNVIFNRKGGILGTLYYLRLIPKLIRSRKIVIHGLFDGWLVMLLALMPFVLNKCYWVVWGGDLYKYQTPKLTLKAKTKELIRAFVIKRLGHLVTYIPGDVELARKWYGAKGLYHECLMYLSNIVETSLSNDSGSTMKNKSTVNILVGNSADPTNNHVEVFDKLSSFKDKNIQIFAPLSYGNPDYARAVIDYGSTIFSEKFTALTDFMQIEDYRRFLASIDIAVFNHSRQQGMGNTITLLGMGKKVYLRKGASHSEFFLKMGLKVEDVEHIDLLRLPESVAEHNSSCVSRYFNKNNLIEQLKQIFR